MPQYSLKGRPLLISEAREVERILRIRDRIYNNVKFCGGGG